MPDETPSLGEVLHRARQAGGEQRPRPWPVEAWAGRDPRLKEMDEAMAAAVAAVVRERVLNTGPTGGELVRETWVYWALEQPDVAEHPNWLKSWAELDERDREVDDRIYSAVAAKAVHDAGLENTRRDAQLFALGAHRAAIFDALKIAITASGYEYERKRYRAALEALGGEEESS